LPQRYHMSNLQINAKSLISMAIGVVRGEKVVISAEGSDADQALECIIPLLESGQPE
jgi:phosphotransferase system HPr-like phosphotransfer protein